MLLAVVGCCLFVPAAMENRRGRPVVRANMGERMLAVQMIERQNMSIAAVARALGRNRATVALWWHRHNEGDNLRDRHGGGHPRLLSEAQEGAILELVGRQPLITAPQIKAELQLECSVDTIRR